MLKTFSKLIEKKKLKDGVFSFILNCKEIAKIAEPGQFVHILVEGLSLRRPISICEIMKENLRIVFTVKGRGTKKMANWQEGEMIDLIGPLGKGFSAITKKDRILLVGGGIGLAPLLEVCKRSSFAITLAGFNTKTDIILEEDFKKNSKLIFCTKDGSYEKSGLVTDFVEKTIKEYKINRIAACGPNAMLETICDIAKKEDIFCEISLEERMACGIGACLCCQKTIKENGTERSIHICKDGPVFDVRQIK